MKIALLPEDDITNGWSAIAPPREVHAFLEGRHEYDWLVIGAGYAGLAAAKRIALAHADQSVALLDAGAIGDNASGRNSGFAIDVPHQVGEPNVEQGQRYARMSRTGILSLEESVKVSNIKCDWLVKGKYHCAVSEKMSTKLLKPDVELLEQMGEPYQWCDRDALEAVTGTRYYHSGVYTPGTVLLNPAALVRGLGDNLPKNVVVYENSPVIELIENDAVVAKTARGEIKARKMILTVNGFVSQFGFLKNKLIPFVLFASLTEKMSAAQQEILGGQSSWGVTPALGTVGPTLRRTEDQRILVRGGFAFSPGMRCSEHKRQRFKNLHKQNLGERFPLLAPTLKFEHFWMGWLTMTGNGSPAFGQLSKNIFCAVGCGGVGIARQTAAGMAVADLASGSDSQVLSDMLSLGEPSRLPGRPIIDLGVNAYLLKEKLTGRIEA